MDFDFNFKRGCQHLAGGFRSYSARGFCGFWYWGGPIVCVTGSLYDITQSYSSSFIVAGSLLMLAGIVCVPLRRVERWDRWKRKRRLRSVEQRPLANIVRNLVWSQRYCCLSALIHLSDRSMVLSTTSPTMEVFSLPSVTTESKLCRSRRFWRLATPKNWERIKRKLS